MSRKVAIAWLEGQLKAAEADRDRLARENERLREVADAAERAVILEYDRGRGPAENTEIEKRARRLREALKALADPGEREGQGVSPTWRVFRAMSGEKRWAESSPHDGIQAENGLGGFGETRPSETGRT